MLYFALSLREMTLSGGNTVAFLYAELKWEWTSYDYSNFATADSLLALVGIIMLSLVGMKVFKLRDTTVVVLSSVSYVAGSLFWPFALVGWLTYVGECYCPRCFYLHF